MESIAAVNFLNHRRHPYYQRQNHHHQQHQKPLIQLSTEHITR